MRGLNKIMKRTLSVIALCLYLTLLATDSGMWNSAAAAATTASNIYINEVDGYQIEVPVNWDLDASKTGTVTRFGSLTVE